MAQTTQQTGNPGKQSSEKVTMTVQATIHWTKDSTETLGDLLKAVPKDEFMSVADVVSAVSEAHKSAGEAHKSAGHEKR